MGGCLEGKHGEFRVTLSVYIIPNINIYKAKLIFNALLRKNLNNFWE